MSADQTHFFAYMRDSNFLTSVFPDPSVPLVLKAFFYPRLSASIRGKKSFWLIAICAICYLPVAFFSSRHALTAFTNWRDTSAAPSGPENGPSPLPETRI